MSDIKTYIDQNKQRFLDELFEWLKIPSVSADPKFKDDINKAAQYIADKFKLAGAENIEVCKTAGNPVVYADKIIDQNLPTILVYGHYDVQPPDPLDLWTSPPFEPVIKKTEAHPDGVIYARGSCDDKGQVYMHVKAFEYLMSEKSLPCNVKFMIEGEEEVGSTNLGTFCKENKERLAADVVLISDTSIIDNETPSINTGLRGLSYMEVEVTGPNKDLHSGVYGGGVANPINILCKMIASLQDEKNRINIPGFYDDVVIVSDTERAEMNKAPFNLTNYKKELGIDDVVGEESYTTLERTSIRPTLDVNGIWGGYTGDGAKTVLPSKAYAKISMRLVPNQTNDNISELFTKHFYSIAPKGVKVKVTSLHGGEPAVTPTDTIEYKAAYMAMEKTFGKAPIPQRSGGSIPIVALFESVLKVKSVLMGFGLDSDDIHSPNEHYGLFNFYKGIETIPYFYQYYAELKNGNGK